jgi:hypothetical protein
MLFATLFNFAGIGLFCWLLYALAIDAVAVYAAVSVGLATFQSGSGLMGAVVVSFVAGYATRTLAGQLAAVRSQMVRIAVTLFYVVPAAVAGYQMSGAFVDFGGASNAWRKAFALLGSIAVAEISHARLRNPAASLPR